MVLAEMLGRTKQPKWTFHLPEACRCLWLLQPDTDPTLLQAYTAVYCEYLFAPCGCFNLKNYIVVPFVPIFMLCLCQTIAHHLKLT